MAARKRANRDGRANDLTFSWLLTTHGKEWTQWQQYAAEWMKEQHIGTNDKRHALRSFFETYLLTYAPYAIDVKILFKGLNGHQCSSNEFVESLKVSGLNDHIHIVKRANYIVDFIDFIIAHHFSKEGGNGVSIPTVKNPMMKVKFQGSSTETVRHSLPYRYIQDLRQILCPIPDKNELKLIEKNLKYGQQLLPPYRYRHFKHWVWAQNMTGRSISRGGDWFEVDESLIDKYDSDCVWRTKTVTRNKKKITIHQLWSPVRAMLIFIKLHLPLRTYQVRFLDSGEADTWRYEDGNWVENTHHNFSMGSRTRPFAKGVFKRISDTMSGNYTTGLYISTNKTADQNKDEVNRGYIIPWQNEEVLYWLEKLRNWQEKYNPITKPMSGTKLELRHFGNIKSDQAKAQIGEICFLFRDASAKGENKAKPIYDTSTYVIWYRLLLTLENQLAAKGITFSNGEPLKLVEDYPEGTAVGAMVSTLFPPHSLRVSLITAYTMDTELPLPVISKLLAGHSRILMTIYYNKITPSVMAKKMAEAEKALENKAEQSIRTFLADASLEQIECKTVFHDSPSIQAALANRNPIGWEYRAQGLCLVGGNTVKSDEISTLGGCWNGGELILDGKNAKDRRYAPVSHGPENCVRCRWFITDASYLPVLCAQFNQLSYKANLAAKLSTEIEGELETLKDEEFLAEEQGIPFLKYTELQALQRRYEKQQVETNEYAKDFIATFNFIQRIIHLEEARGDEDTSNKLIAKGSHENIKHSMKIMETQSELLHLSLLCDDVEFYPDLQDELGKSPAVSKRTIQLSRIMMRKGYTPILLEMDDKMQLIAINAMMRKMAAIADPSDKLEGFRKVSSYLEAEEYLCDSKLLEMGIRELSKTSTISLKDISSDMKLLESM